MSSYEIPQPYPLQWPAGKPRARFRIQAPFHRITSREPGMARQKARLGVGEAVKRLQGELDRLGARLPVISSNLELRLDGLPRSDRQYVPDPGIAVYFQLKGRPMVLACDQYDRATDNIAAIAAHIDAMRTAERHGVGSLEQMFVGFAALPGAVAPDDWREPLGNPTSLEEAERNYRDRMRYAHPDTVAEEDRAAHEIVAAKLNAAIEAARKYFAT